MAKNEMPCPCGSRLEYRDCCKPYITRREIPATAESLMRSRYTAYTLYNEQYLLETWHASTRPDSLQLDADAPIKWLGLKIIATDKGGNQDNEGHVEFVARYKVNGKAHRLHENSRFSKQNQQWYYVDGELK